MTTRASEFASRHAGSQSPRVAELVRAIGDGAVALRSVSEGASSEELARTYAVRSSVAASKGHAALSSEMQALAELCASNAGNPSAVWLFEGTSFSFAAFELLPSRHVAGCFRFEGAVWSGAHNAA